MKIGIISDTHDHVEAIETAVGHFSDAGVSVCIHCGDIASPEMIQWFEDFEFHAVLGNNDEPYREELDERISALGPESEFHGLFAELDFDGLRFAVTHGVVEDRIYEYAETGTYDYVLHGHFHETEATVLDSGTTVINPGAHRSVVVLDTESDEFEFIEL